MADRRAPRLYTIPIHFSFADALAAGLLRRAGEDPLALARTLLILPNSRARQAVTEAFVREAGAGLLLPRMVTIGDIDLDELPGSFFDPADTPDAALPAADPLLRQFALADLIASEGGARWAERGLEGRLRLAREMGRTIDQLLVEEIAPRELLDLDMGELQSHWQDALALFSAVWAKWRERCAAEGWIEATERRNLMLRAAARRWTATPPAAPIVAAGITTAAPAVAQVLKAIAFLPDGMVVLPGVDIQADAEIWETIGTVRADTGPGDKPPASPAHPQFHLKLLLDRMDVARDEIAKWREGGQGAATPDRERLVRSMFLPSELSDRWHDLPANERRAADIQRYPARTQDEEAQAIAILAREAIETPLRRVAIVTPDRDLAARISAHLARWGIRADDSAGQPLSLTPPGTLLLAMAAAVQARLAPVELLALLKHPLVHAGEARQPHLDLARDLDLALRGPRPAAGLAGLMAYLRGADKTFGEREGWRELVAALLEPLDALAKADAMPLAGLLTELCRLAGEITDGAIWRGEAGRQLSRMVERLAERAAASTLAPGDLPALLRLFMDEIAVRPAYGSHPRIAIYGLIEARLQRADLMICAGLSEGSWPRLPDPDPWLAPMVRRKLGLPSAEFRIGLAAHDLAGCLGGREVALTHAARDSGGPVIASRFLLRLEAVTGGALPVREDLAEWAQQLDRRLELVRVAPPAPDPAPEQRQVDVAVTDLDRLRADPFAFYARSILKLPVLDALDAPPGPKWRGIAVHEVLERWQKEDGLDPARLMDRARQLLEDPSVNAVVRALWQPRLMAALQWVADETAAQHAAGRIPAAAEIRGTAEIDGVTIIGKADRIDRLADGTLAIVDFKTGKPPSAAQVEAGFALQLGLLGLIAERGGFAGISGDPRSFEYWSLAKPSRGGEEAGFGYVDSPILQGRKRSGVALDDFLPHSLAMLRDALGRWINGREPFTAKLNPDYAGYTDYDQLMRLDEWYGRGPAA